MIDNSIGQTIEKSMMIKNTRQIKMLVSKWKVLTVDAIQIEVILRPKTSFTTFIIPKLTLDTLSVLGVVFSTWYGAMYFFQNEKRQEKQNENQYGLTVFSYENILF